MSERSSKPCSHVFNLDHSSIGMPFNVLSPLKEVGQRLWIGGRQGSSIVLQHFEESDMVCVSARQARGGHNRTPVKWPTVY